MQFSATTSAVKNYNAPHPQDPRQENGSVLPHAAPRESERVMMLLLSQRRKAYRRFARRLFKWCKVSTLTEWLRLASRHVVWRNARKSIQTSYRQQRLGLAPIHMWHYRCVITPRTAILNLIHNDAQETKQ
jgi:hypothetical protein